MRRAQQVLGVENNNNNNNNRNRVTTETKRYLRERVDKKEEQVLKIEANVIQVANYYFVFQGVILTVVVKGSSSSSLKCEHVWVPLSLTLIGAIVNFGALLIIAEKYRDSLNELDTRTNALYTNLYPDRAPATRSEDERMKKNKKACRKFIMVLSTILLFIFALINLVAACLILCP